MVKRDHRNKNINIIEYKMLQVAIHKNYKYKFKNLIE